MKKVYVASRFALKDEVKQIYSKLEKLGYSVSKDWTRHKSIKPYASNPDLSREYAIEDINGARNSDLFILITDAEGTGMYAELGAALGHNLEFGKPAIYVIGAHLSASFIFFHPSVKRRENIDEVIKELEEASRASK